MWLYLNDSALSIVAHRGRPSDLLVRARIPGDIEAVFPGSRAIEMAEADYRYRAIVPRETVAAALADRARNIDYDNFKNSVADDARHDVYFRAYAAFLDGVRAFFQRIW